MIADTSYIIDLAAGERGAYAKALELEKRKEPLAITVLTLFEMWQGSGKLSQKEFRVLNDLAENSLIITLEPENAKTAGIIRSKLKKAGFQLGAADSLIAGVTFSGNDTLLTRNIKDFSRIEGIKVETY